MAKTGAKAGKKAVPKKANTRQFAGVLIVVGVIGAALLGYVLTRPKAITVTFDPAAPAGPSEPHVLGKPDAPVKLVEFGDFECPTCGEFATVTEPDVRARLVNTGIVQFQFYDFPLEMHKNTWAAHIAASCAEAQGKFWEMHDRVFAGQTEWNGEATGNPKKVLLRYARELGLDTGAWEACLDTQQPVPRIKANAAEGIRRNVNGTPTFFIGDKQVGPSGYDAIKKLVDEALAAAKPDSAARKR